MVTIIQPLTVNVSYGDGCYTAECDALHLVAEASTLDELTHSVWGLVPDLIELNALPYDIQHLRLRFDVVRSPAKHRAVMHGQRLLPATARHTAAPRLPDGAPGQG